MVWRELKNHSDCCYFFSFIVKEYNSKWKRSILYPKSSIYNSPHPWGFKYSSTQAPCCLKRNALLLWRYSYEPSSNFEDDSGPKCFFQEEVNDLVRNLNISKSYSDHGSKARICGRLKCRFRDSDIMKRISRLTFPW